MVAMMAMTTFAVVASDDLNVTGGGVAPSNEDPIKVSPVQIDSNWTTSRPVWNNCPDVMYDVVDGIPTITFDNANVEMDIDVNNNRSCLTFLIDSDTNIVLKGNNEICANMNCNDAVSSYIFLFGIANHKLTVNGESLKDTLTLTTVSDAKNNEKLKTYGISATGLEINNCTINFVLEKEKDSGTGNRFYIPMNESDVKCTNSKLTISIKDVTYDYEFIGFSTDKSITMFNSTIEMSMSNKIKNTSRMFDIWGDNATIDIDCCKMDIEMGNGVMFKEDSASGTVITFDNFKSIELYKTAAQEPTVVQYDGNPYVLDSSDWDIAKIIVDSDLIEPKESADNSLAVVATVSVSVLVALLAILVILFRRRDTI